MEARTPCPGTRAYRQMKGLYQRAFPAAERRPLWLLWLISRRRTDNRLTAWYDENTFVGMVYTVETEKYRYISHIAVSEELRSKGCGGALLKTLQEQEPRRELLVEVETPEETAENNAIRIRRKNFYLRNGFYDTGRHIKNRGVHYDILSTCETFDSADYWDIFDRMSLGLKDMLRSLGKK